jgi:tetratricopeptide (TPR) repeat protein
MSFIVSSRFVVFLPGMFLALVAQQTTRPPSSTPTAPGGSNSPSRSTNPSTNVPGRPQFPDGTTDQAQRPIFVTGKVLLSDGIAPPEPVVIDRICGSRVVHEGFTDSKGRFSIELGRNTSLFMDASSDSMGGGGFGNRAAGPAVMGNPSANTVNEKNLMGCELRASLPGFRSSSVMLSNRRFLDNPDVGTLVLQRLSGVEGTTISATSLAAPKDAKKAFDKGHEAVTKGKLDEAAKQFDKALEQYPRYAVAWYERGQVYEAQHLPEDAKKAYQEALKIDSKLITPYDRLAAMAASSRNWADAADITDRMIRLNPMDFPRAYLLNAISNLNLGNLEAAEKSANELIKLDANHKMPKAEQVLAVVLAQRKDWEPAAEHFRRYIELTQPGPDQETAKKQLAEIEKTLAAQKN